MSDPVTNVDVEDVLSSIRRLVSDTNSEDRQASKAPEVVEPTAEEMPQEAAKVSDALILTSALRVKSSEEDSVPEFRHTDMSNLRSTISDSSPQHDDTSPDVETSDWAVLADEDYYEDEVPTESAPVIDFIRHGSLEAEVEVPDDEATIEQLDAGDDAPVDEWGVAEGTEDDAANDDAANDDAVQEWADEAQEDAELEVAVAAEEHEDDHVGEEVAPVEAEIAAADQEDVAVELAPEPEEEFFEFEEMAEPLVEEAVFASAAAASVMDKDEEPVVEDDFDLSNLDDNNLIDEDALRDLVAEIVRQELTGDLGERITRNVRKLVRREIHRALLTREFE